MSHVEQTNDSIGRGRRPRFQEQKDVLDVLRREIVTVGENLSYYHKRKLVAGGFLTAHEIKRDSGRGRNTQYYTLSPKACVLLNLPKQYSKFVKTMEDDSDVDKELETGGLEPSEKISTAKH